MRTITVLLALGALLAGAARAEAAERHVPRGWLGITLDGPFQAGDAEEWDRMVEAGVESVRRAFFWAQLQPYATEADVPDPLAPRFQVVDGVPTDFASTDAFVVAAAQRGLALVPVMQWPPDWAAARPGDFGSPPARPADVRRVFGSLVRRYGPGGSLWAEQPGLPYRPIRTWQVFNEPDLPWFWSIQPFERRYTATLRAAEQGIHGADPSATVLLAGLPGGSWRTLEALYAAGARGSFDAVAVHPYTARPANLLRIVRYARAVMRSHRDGRLPIWVTEFGWPAAAGQLRNPPPWASVTDAAQARRLNRAMRRLVAARVRLRIDGVFWYSWLTSETGQSVFNWSGLRRIRDGKRVDTAALRAFRTWARRLEGCTKARGDARRCA